MSPGDGKRSEKITNDEMIWMYGNFKLPDRSEWLCLLSMSSKRNTLPEETEQEQVGVTMSGGLQVASVDLNHVTK